MSMRHYPDHGYVVELDKLLKLLEPEDQSLYQEQSPCDGAEIRDFLDGRLPEGIPQPEDIFMLEDEDLAEELERGVWYAVYSQVDLYHLAASPALEALRARGVLPAPQTWARWG